MNKDPRKNLADKLIQLGLKASTANLISIEAGASQTIVNRLYLEELGIGGSFQDQIYNEVVKFYMGEFSYFENE